MNRMMLATGISLLLILPGCCGQRRDHDRQIRKVGRETCAFQAQITGMWAPGESSPFGQFCDFSHVRIGEQPMACPVERDLLFQTDTALRFRTIRTLGEREENVTFVMGVSLNPGTTATGSFSKEYGELNLVSGWIFVWGQLPTVKTEWVSAGAEGTTMAVEIKSGVHRVYFVSADGAERVNLTTAASAKSLTAAGTFVDVTSTGSISPQKKIADDVAAREFIEKAGAMARAAGWTG